MAAIMLQEYLAEIIAPNPGHTELAPGGMGVDGVSYGCKRNMLRGGEVIAEGLPKWMDCNFSKEELWEYVAQATRHRMKGWQLQELHSALHRQELGKREAANQDLVQMHQQTLRLHRDGLVTSKRWLPLNRKGLIQSDMQQLLQRFPLERMGTAEGAAACAAELETMAGQMEGKAMQSLLLDSASQVRTAGGAIEGARDARGQVTASIRRELVGGGESGAAKRKVLAQQVLQQEQYRFCGVVLPQGQQPLPPSQQQQQQQLQHQSGSTSDVAAPPATTSGERMCPCSRIHGLHAAYLATGPLQESGPPAHSRISSMLLLGKHAQWPRVCTLPLFLCMMAELG
jgi:hypothetical protein